MSIRFDNTTERLSRTANVPDDRSFTMCGWFQRVSHAGSFVTACGISQASSSPSHSFELAWSSAGALEITAYNAPANTTVFSTNYTNDQWFFGALTGATSTFTGYAGGPTVGILEAITVNVPQNYTPAIFWVGDNGWSEGANFRAAALKVWDVALTATELEQERWYYAPARLANLNLWTPLLLHTDVNDRSGNARNWTTTGTLSTEDGPPIGWAPRSRRYFIPGAAAATVLPPHNMIVSQAVSRAANW